MLRFAANLSLLFHEVPFLQRFDLAAQAGFRGVECLFPYAYSPNDLAARLADSGLQQVLFNTSPGDFEERGERGIAGIPGREAEFSASLAQALRYADALACPRLHVLAGLIQHGAESATLIKNLQKAAPLAAAQGVELLIEPINSRDIPGYLINRTSEALSLIEQVGATNVRLQLDLYHRQIVEGELIAALEAYLPIAAHLQIAQPPDRGEPDSGEIDYRAVFGLLEQHSYQEWIGCEYKPRGGTLEGLAWVKHLGVSLGA
ncbi:MAG: hydroxypyruvate isomerase [Gammaproteobacteria bacterium]|nr:hydroxypyruvate isomerase [Gammaproteobacteria bacterium]